MSQIFINLTTPSTLVPVIIPTTIMFSKFCTLKYKKIEIYLKNYTGIDYTAAFNVNSLFDLQIETGFTISSERSFAAYTFQ